MIYNVYNIMFTTSLLLWGTILASILPQTISFDIKIGPADTLLKDYGLKTAQEVEESGLFVRKSLIFPYDVYELATPNSNAPEAKSYLFVKMAYTLLADSFALQNKSIEHANQYEILYKRIPQIALFQGKTNQYLELIREDPSLFNPHFIIKNSTLENRASGLFSLNFYSLRLTKYLERIIKSAQNQRKSSLKKEQVAKMLTTDQHFTVQLIKQNEHQANQFILTKFFDNDIYYKSLYATEIFNVQMSRQITNDTLWSAKSDGFSIYYSSAMVKGKKGAQNSKDHGSYIDFILIVSRENEEKRIQHIKQPLDYLNLTSVQHLEICFSMEALKLMLTDTTNIYVIDVTTHLWNLDYYRSAQTFQDVFFDKNCKVFNVNNKLVSQINGIRKVQLQSPIVSVHRINNFISFCLQGKTCKVYSNDLQKQVTEITSPANSTNLVFEQILRVNQTQIEHILGYRQKWGHYLLQKKINEFSVIQTTSTYNYSYFYEFVYPFELYLDKPQIKQRQMDKMFFHHLEYLQNKDIYKLPTNYFEFSRLLSSSNCTQRNSSDSDEVYSINGQGDWSICTISVSTSNLILFKIETANVQAKMYICESPLQNYSSNQEIDCQYYTSAANTEKSYYISNNKHIKFYILRVPKQKYFPKFYFRDIQKQQLAFASTVFFFLMLILALSFFIIIVFIVFRPVLIGMMVYFGWMQDVVVPTYPLGWLQLKIKIKRLVEMKFLSYVPHEPSNEDEDNHCCFCLENLSKGALIAQLYCYHEFHKECFNQWIKNEPNLRCPTCRRQFTRQHLNEFRSTHNLVE